MRVRPMFLSMILALVACGDSTQEAPVADDTTAGAAAQPAPLVLAGDTLMDRASLRCADGRLVSVGYFKGATRRAAVNLVGDSSVWARATEADTGSRYATLDESLILWTKGDTTSLTWQGRITSCVIDNTIEF